MGTAAKREPVVAYVGIGGNLGDARAAVQHAIESLAGLPESRVLAVSALYRTAPVGAHGPDFTNAVACIETRMAAPDLLRALQSIEHAAGRERPYPNAPRTLDLDLLLYGSARIESAQLMVPHPRMAERAFVLVPLAEIAPALVGDPALAALRGQRIERIGPAGGT